MTAAAAAMRAARLDDEISHGFGLLGMIAGAVIGAVVAAAIIAGTAATGGLLLVAIVGGCIAGGGLAGGMLAQGIMKAANLPDPTTGTLTAGSPNVTINGQPAMRADLDMSSCCNGLYTINHYPLWGIRIAEGSKTVTVNGKPMARVSMRLECGAKIKTGSENVLVGGPTARVLTVWDAEEWVKNGLEILGVVALLAGGGAALVGGGLIALVEFGGVVTLLNIGLGELHEWGESLGPGYGDIMVGVAGFALLIGGAKLASGEKPVIETEVPNATETVTAYRVDTNGFPARVVTGPDGAVEVPTVITKSGNERALFVNFGDEARAMDFALQNRAGNATVTAVEVDKGLLENLRLRSITEGEANLTNDAVSPLRVDKVFSDQYGLRTPEDIQLFRDAIKPGSGKIIYPKQN